MCHVTTAVISAMNNPGLSIIDDSVLEVNHMEGHLVANSMETYYIAIFSLAIKLHVFEACLVY